MAVIKNTHLGVITGRIGDNIFKTRNGTQYVAAPAVIHHKSDSTDAIHGRKVFMLTNKMFSALGKIYMVRTLWKESSISKGTFINKMQIVNKKKIDKDYDLINVIQVPFENPFQIEIESAEFSEKVLIVTIKKPTQTLKIIAEVKCCMQGVVHCERVDEPKSEEHMFIPISSGEITYTEENQMTFILKLESVDASLMSKFPKRKFYINMIIKNPKGIPYKASTNVSGII